jgi:adenylate cyclase
MHPRIEYCRPSIRKYSKTTKTVVDLHLHLKSRSERLPLNNLDHVDLIDLEAAIKDSQTRMLKILKVKPEFKISLIETQRILEKYVESKINLIILHIDLVGSTRMSMTMSIDKLSTIIRAFAQEISLVVSMYGGYVLKYIGDAVLAFFVVEKVEFSNDDKNNTISSNLLQGNNVISCACTAIKIIKQGLNPILNQYDYPELKIRIGIDFGEIGIVQYGSDIDVLDEKVFTRPHIDLIGSTISIAVKITSFAEPDQIVIGEKLFNELDEKQKITFKQISDTSNIGKSISGINEGKYRVYTRL